MAITANNSSKIGAHLLPLLVIVALGFIGSVRSLECYTCDSAHDAFCYADQLLANGTETTDTLQECEYSEGIPVLHCYTYRGNDGQVRRGCLHDETEEVQQLCLDELAGGGCVLCEGDGCNVRTTEKDVCIECDSTVDAECGRLDGTTGNSTTATVDLLLEGVVCPLSVDGQVGCYRYEGEDDHIKRGCISSLPSAEATTCQSNTSTCKTCQGRQCNAKPAFQQCRTCDSSISTLCIRSPASAPSLTCSAYLDECITHVRSDRIVRGCRAEITDAEIVADCRVDVADAPESHCSRCSSGANCNGRTIDGEFCIECEATTDPRCLRSPNVTQHVQCPLAVNPKGCYLFDDGADDVKRGCVRKLHENEQAKCRLLGDDECKTCVGNDCNRRPAFQKCHTCSSASNGLSCIRSPASFALRTCPLYTDSCVTHVRDDVVTRGCASELTLIPGTALQADCAGESSDFCAKCSGPDGCNSQLVDGEFCMACSSETDADCVANATHSLRVQCPLGVGQLGCYRSQVRNGNTTVVERGCVAQLAEEAVVSCRLGQSGCKTCKGNDCNAKPDFQKCRRCSSLDSVSCIRSPNAFASVECASYTDSCFVHVHENVVTRGCQAEHLPVDVTACSGPECKTCETGTNCNNRLIDGEFCLECDSTVDGHDCRSNLTHTLRKQCPLSPERRGCYLFDDGGDIVKRGCAADLATEEEAMCNGQTSTCKTCFGDDCNAKPSFQRCRVCNSADSVTCVRSANSILSQQCRAYDDECYAHVVDNVVQRGCLKEATEVIQSNCETHPELCEKCSGGICNGATVDGEFCMQCDSTADPNCVAALNVTMRVQCSLSNHPRGCYRFDDGGGETLKRGCVSDLHSDEELWCNGGVEHPTDQQECKICTGNDCNARVAVQHCKTCNSTENVDCIRYVKNYIDATECSLYDDRCFTHVSGNVTIRGCASEWPTLAADCTANPELCDVCQSDPSSPAGTACNDRIVDGEFCVTCDSNANPACRDNVGLEMRTQCSLAVTPLGCYDQRNATRVQRGCISDLPLVQQRACKADATAADGVGCKVCDGNECNVRALFAECAVCDSAVDEGCVRMQQPEADEYLEICEAYDDQCYTWIGEGERVRRGCLKQLLAETQETCEDESTCQKCDTLGCNRLNLEPEFCLACSNSTDSMCTQTQLESCSPNGPSTALSFDRKGCYHSIDDEEGIVQRGCVTKLEANQQQICSYQLSCKTCQNVDECNGRADFQRCYSCDSVHADSLCERDVTKFTEPMVCIPYEDTCTQMVLANGVTRRACTSQIDQEVVEPGPPAQLRKECDGNGCNGGVYPADRRRCHRCSGEGCNAFLTKNDATFQVCPEYLEEDLCYAFLDESTDTPQMVRGCHSDYTDDKRRCNEAGSKCRLCPLSNGCNNAAALRDPALSCVQCSNGEDCAWGQAVSASKPCMKQLLFGHSETCYTFHNTSITKRGCSNDDLTTPIECPSDVEQCSFCAGYACNVRNYAQQHCQRCLGGPDGLQVDCRDAETVTGYEQQCPMSPGNSTRYEERGCFTLRDGDEVLRGCVSEMSEEQRTNCSATGQKTCVVCLEENCNTKKAPSSAGQMVATVVLIVSMLVAVLCVQ